MKYVLIMLLFLTACSDDDYNKDKIDTCYRKSIRNYSYRVTAVADGYFHVEYVDGTTSTENNLLTEVPCTQFEEDKLWYTVKKDIENLKNKVNVLEGKVK